MKAAIDLTGQRFGRLSVDLIHSIKRVKGRSRYYYWCKCDCGDSKAVENSQLTCGLTKSCGCLQREQREAGDNSRKHGCRKIPEYAAWKAAKSRCFNTKAKSYQYYGARGIKVCDRWRDSFENFYSDIGDRPTSKHSLDRIDVNGNYSPENCRWATQIEQCNNKRNNHRITIGEVTLTDVEWERKMGLKRGVIHARIKRGWSGYDAIFTPSQYLAITVGCVTLSIGQWVKETGINRSTIHGRLDRGWSEADAVCIPNQQSRLRSPTLKAPHR